jgi:hypothetical protein
MAPRPRSSQLKDSTLKLPNNQENYTTKAFLFAQKSPLLHQERIRPPTKRGDLNSDSPVSCPGQQLKAAAQQVLAGLMAEQSKQRCQHTETTPLLTGKENGKWNFSGDALQEGNREGGKKMAGGAGGRGRKKRAGRRPTKLARRRRRLVASVRFGCW